MCFIVYELIEYLPLVIVLYKQVLYYKQLIRCAMIRFDSSVKTINSFVFGGEVYLKKCDVLVPCRRPHPLYDERCARVHELFSMRTYTQLIAQYVKPERRKLLLVLLDHFGGHICSGVDDEMLVCDLLFPCQYTALVREYRRTGGALSALRIRSLLAFELVFVDGEDAVVHDLMSKLSHEEIRDVMHIYLQGHNETNLELKWTYQLERDFDHFCAGGEMSEYVVRYMLACMPLNTFITKVLRDTNMLMFCIRYLMSPLLHNIKIKCVERKKNRRGFTDSLFGFIPKELYYALSRWTTDEASVEYLFADDASSGKSPKDIWGCILLAVKAWENCAEAQALGSECRLKHLAPNVYAYVQAEVLAFEKWDLRMFQQCSRWISLLRSFVRWGFKGFLPDDMYLSRSESLRFCEVLQMFSINVTIECADANDLIIQEQAGSETFVMHFHIRPDDVHPNT